MDPSGIRDLFQVGARDELLPPVSARSAGPRAPFWGQYPALGYYASRVFLSEIQHERIHHVPFNHHDCSSSRGVVHIPCYWQDDCCRLCLRHRAGPCPRRLARADRRQAPATGSCRVARSKQKRLRRWRSSERLPLTGPLSVWFWSSLGVVSSQSACPFRCNTRTNANSD